EHDAGPTRRQADVLNVLTDLLDPRPHAGQVAADGDVELVRLAGLQVEQVQPVDAVEDDRVGARRGRLDVCPVGRQHAADLAGSGVVGVQRGRAAAVGEEEDLRSDPHGVEIVGVLAGQFLDRGGLQVGDPYERRAAAAVLFPGDVPPGKAARVGERDVGQV